jgi:hypothetical protein
MNQKHTASRARSKRATRTTADPHPKWREWQKEDAIATAEWRAYEDRWLAGEPVIEAERQRLWVRMNLTCPRRRLERVNLRLPIVRCHVCRCVVGDARNGLARDRDVGPLIVKANYDLRAALALIAEYEECQPFPRWRLTLLRIIHEAPMAYPEELEVLEASLPRARQR